ncbi:MAG TPA: sensor domain-containing diguanylate cyclase [Anaerolineales bacterium]|nr:sensor domain-containing diguanylate cyclase [Anaerolineales bacterium]HNO30807.1 sensor domain-containing diguanylate cyclase [Anaerolineales bacterium]
MNDTPIRTGSTFARAWEVIAQDESISAEEKRAILKMIQTLAEAADRSSEDSGGSPQIITQEVISRHSLLATVKHQADELDALKRISLNLTSSLDLQEVLDTVVVEAMGLIRNARAVHIFLYERGQLEFGSSLDSGGAKNIPIWLPRKNGLTHSVIHKRVPIIIEDMFNSPLYKNSPIPLSGSIIGIPLTFKNEIVGVLNLSRSVKGHFTRSELRLINLLADQAAVAIYNANLYKRVNQMANTDSITGLPNRRALDERLQEEWQYASRMSTHFAVVMMDMDGFKAVNDTFGHKVGDDLLYSLFNFLAQKMRSSDFLARYGGDELTLVMRGTDLTAAEIVTQKVIDLMKEFSFQFPEGEYMELGLSAGIAVYPIHAETPSDLLRAADSALYHAKKHFRGKYVVAKGVTGRLSPIRLNSSR